MKKIEDKNELLYTNDFSKDDFKINLLPNRLHYISLARNLPKSVWNKFRKEHIEMKNGTCELCGIKMNSYHNCHEIFQVYGKVIKLTDIKVLCRNCHMTQHIGFVSLGKASINIEELAEHYEKVSKRNFDTERLKADKEYNLAMEMMEDKDFIFMIDENLLGKSIIENYCNVINEIIANG